MYSSKMTVEYSLPYISLTFTYVITNKTLILSIFRKWRSPYFPAKKPALDKRKKSDNLYICLVVNGVPFQVKSS